MSKENRKTNEMGANSPQNGKEKTMNKEYLYVGHYIDIDGNHILKIGTTNDLKRRRTDHTRNYRKAKNYTMPPTETFEYDWFIPLSKYNTLRFEDKNRERWQEMEIGDFVRNDRFNCGNAFPPTVDIIIKKTYTIALV